MSRWGMGIRNTAQARLRADIEAAKEEVGAAEDDLQAVVGDLDEAASADKTKLYEVVRGASRKLSAARAKLLDLEESLADTKLEVARTAIREAEQYLDAVLRETKAEPGSDTTWVTKVVRDAFTKLRVAKDTLAKLESIATDEE